MVRLIRVKVWEDQILQLCSFASCSLGGFLRVVLAVEHFYLMLEGLLAIPALWCVSSCLISADLG